VLPEEGEPGLRGAGEPPVEGRADPLEIGAASRDRHDRHAGGAADRVEVEDVEPPDDRSVDQDRADPVSRPQRPEQPDDPGGAVPPVDAYPGEPDRLDPLRRRDDDGGDRRVPVPPGERSVIDADDPRVRLPEGSPQR